MSDVEKDSQKRYFPFNLEDLTDNYTIYLEENDYKKACKDLRFATKLLENHKRAMTTQWQHTLRTETEEESLKAFGELEKVPLRLQDARTNKIYTFFVTVEKCHRANSGNLFSAKQNILVYLNHVYVGNNFFAELSFATQLLHKQLASIKEPSAACSLEDLENCSSNKSKRSVAATSSTKIQKTAKTILWPHEAVLLLLSLYKDNDELYRDEKITSTNFWSNIHQGMTDKQYTYTIEQCVTKMESFKRAYKNAREKRGKTGRPPKDVPYYDLLDELFCDKKWANPIALVGSDKPLGEIDNKPCKKQKVALDEAKEQFFKECAEDKCLKRQAADSYRTQKLNLLSRGMDILEKFFEEK